MEDKTYEVKFASHSDLKECLSLIDAERLESRKKGAKEFVASILRDKETLDSCRFGYEFDGRELKKYLLEKLKNYETIKTK